MFIATGQRYTNAVLTVIAICLIAIVARDFMPEAKAQAKAEPTHVIISGIDMNVGHALPIINAPTKDGSVARLIVVQDGPVDVVSREVSKVFVTNYKLN